MSDFLPGFDDPSTADPSFSPEVMQALGVFAAPGQSPLDALAAAVGHDAQSPATPPPVQPYTPGPPRGFLERLAASGGLPAVPATSRQRGGGVAAAYDLLAGFANARAASAGQDRMAREKAAQATTEAQNKANLEGWKAASQARADRLKALISLQGRKPAEATFPLPDAVRKAMADSGVPPEQIPRSATLDNISKFASNFGGKPQDTSADLAPSLTDEELDLPALLYLRTGQMMPAGMGKAGIALREKVVKHAAKLSRDFGLSPDIATNRANYQADQRSLTSLQSNLDAVTAFKSTAIKNMKVAIDAIDKVSDTGSPIANDLVRAVQNKLLGNADVTAFNSAITVAAPEFARIIANPTLSGVALTDQARKDIQAVMKGDFTRKQLRSAFGVLVKDSDNRLTSYQSQLELIRRRMTWRAADGSFLSGQGLPAPSVSDTTASKQRPGKVYVEAPDGKRGWYPAGKALPTGYRVVQ